MHADWAVDSGIYAELANTAPRPAVTGLSQSTGPAAQSKPQQAGPKKSSISLAAITAGMHSSDHSDKELTQPQHGSDRGASANPQGSSSIDTPGRRSYLSVLESLAQGSHGSSPAGSDNEAALQSGQQSSRPAGSSAGAHSPGTKQDGASHSPLPIAKPVTASASKLLSEESSSFADDNVEALLPDEASAAHMYGQTEQAQGSAFSAPLPDIFSGPLDSHTDLSIAQQGEELSPLAMALANLAATAAQKQEQQQAMQLSAQQHAVAATSEQETAEDEEMPESSASSSSDIIGHAAAAAAAAGLSRQHEALQSMEGRLPALTNQTLAQPDAGSMGSSASQDSAEDQPLEPEADIQIQMQQAQRAEQEVEQHSRSASVELAAPVSSGPSWSGASGDAARGIGRFHDHNAINYVGKSARRPKVSFLLLAMVQRFFQYKHSGTSIRISRTALLSSR